jgi:hypothetical protein
MDTYLFSEENTEGNADASDLELCLTALSASQRATIHAGGGAHLHAAGFARDAVQNRTHVAKLFSHGVAKFFLPGRDKHGALVEPLECLAALGFVSQGQQLQNGCARAQIIVLAARHVIKLGQHGGCLSIFH